MPRGYLTPRSIDPSRYPAALTTSKYEKLWIEVPRLKTTLPRTLPSLPSMVLAPKRWTSRRRPLASVVPFQVGPGGSYSPVSSSIPTSALDTAMLVSASETTTSIVTSLVTCVVVGEERCCSTWKVSQQKKPPTKTRVATRTARI